MIHCFSEDREFARAALDLGFRPVVFRHRDLQERAQRSSDVARLAPEERILVETDSPYLAPVPLRGKPCEPAYIVHTARALAELRGVELERIAEATTANAVPAFRSAAGRGRRLCQTERSVRRPIASLSLLTSFVLAWLGLGAGSLARFAFAARSELGAGAAPARGSKWSSHRPTASSCPPCHARGIAGAPDRSRVPSPSSSCLEEANTCARPEHAARGPRRQSRSSAQAALNLADSNDGLTLDRDPLNRLDRSQLQRLRHESRAPFARRSARHAQPHGAQLSRHRSRARARAPSRRADEPVERLAAAATEPTCIGQPCWAVPRVESGQRRRSPKPGSSSPGPIASASRPAVPSGALRP